MSKSSNAIGFSDSNQMLSYSLHLKSVDSISAVIASIGQTMLEGRTLPVAQEFLSVLCNLDEIVSQDLYLDPGIVA